MFAIVRSEYTDDSYDWDFHQRLTFVDFELAQNLCDHLNAEHLFPTHRVVKMRFEDL